MDHENRYAEPNCIPVVVPLVVIGAILTSIALIVAQVGP